MSLLLVVVGGVVVGVVAVTLALGSESRIVNPQA